eukprot:GEMP01126712.1.p1 GENE.GEMP01126712.1~~GEMP01126712.1.p1  ORF type:complete len:102 (+),score=2.84 GEMP01126712.1:217-522(+)
MQGRPKKTEDPKWYPAKNDPNNVPTRKKQKPRAVQNAAQIADMSYNGCFFFFLLASNIKKLESKRVFFGSSSYMIKQFESFGVRSHFSRCVCVCRVNMIYF